MKRLIDLHPVFLDKGGEDITDQNGNPVPVTKGVGIQCDCPGCDDENHLLFVPFTVALDGTPLEDRPNYHRWVRHGTTFEDLTLTPSILRKCGCGWHGHLINGVFKGCDESFSEQEIIAFKNKVLQETKNGDSIDDTAEYVVHK